MSTLNNKIAVVTGATGGIGRAIAVALASHGAVLVLSGRNQTKLEAVANECRAHTSEVETCPADLTSETDVATMCDAISSRHGRLDILVHSAGAIAHGSLSETDVSSLDSQYAANVRGPLLLTQKLIPLLKQPRGQIVFINSSVGLNARANTGHFSATQHAFKAIADAMRDEINADGVRVMSVYPGRTATPRIDALFEKEGRAYQPETLLQPEDVASVVLNAMSLPWTAEVTDIKIRPMQKSY